MRHICMGAASAMDANELCAIEALLKPPSLVLHRSRLHASSTYLHLTRCLKRVMQNVVTCLLRMRNALPIGLEQYEGQMACVTHAKLASDQSRSEKKSRRSVGNIREIVPLQRREDAACASGIHTLHAPPSLPLQPWRR